MKKIILLFATLLFSLTNVLAQQDAQGMLDALKKEGKIALYINFETAKSDINPESGDIIKEVVAMLQIDKSLKISVEGHTDNAGDQQINQKLSENRAKAVMVGIVKKGIDKSRITYKGWGAEKPIADNNTEDAKARNRRVEIVKR